MDGHGRSFARLFGWSPITFSGGSKGAPGTRAPPGGPNSFIFMQFSAKKIGNAITEMDTETNVDHKRSLGIFLKDFFNKEKVGENIIEPQKKIYQLKKCFIQKFKI